MARTYDAIIVGAGTMGSAAAYHLSDRGQRIIAFEQFRVVNDQGSHSGKTRIIRQAYFESPQYVPLVVRAQELWQRLQELSGMLLLLRTGGIDIGPPEGKLVTGALESARLHDLPCSHLRAHEILSRWPQFRIPDSWDGCYDENAGFLFVEPCINAHIGAAEARGASIREGEKVLSFSDQGSHVTVRTSGGTYEAGRLIVCGGPWSAKLLQDINIPITVTRQPLAWLRTENKEAYALDKFLVFLAETDDGIFYGFPVHHFSGVKIAQHVPGAPIDPDDPNRTFLHSDAEAVIRFAARYMNGISDEVLEGKICLYSMTPDEHFIIDFHPSSQNIFIAAGFSGHGFKFAPVIGEIIADLVCDQKSSYPIEMFRLGRFHS